MEQLCLPFNHEPCINHMAVIMANEDIANGYWDNWDAAYESNWDILENEIAAQEDERRMNESPYSAHLLSRLVLSYKGQHS